MEETPFEVFETPWFGPKSELRLYEHEVEVTHSRKKVWKGRVTGQRLRYEQIAQVVISDVPLGPYKILVIESTGGHTMRINPLSQDAANKACAAIQERMNLVRERGVAETSSSTPTVAAQIQELANLHDTGILTEEEFQTKKRDLLDRL
jgi:hypothetical protein